MILIDSAFWSSVGVVSNDGNPNGNQYDFYNSIEMSNGETVRNQYEFFKNSPVDGVYYENQYEWYKAIGVFHSEPIYDQYTFYKNVTFDGVNPVGNQYEFFKGLTFSDLYSVLLDGISKYININSTLTPLSSTTVSTWCTWYKPTDGTPPSSEILISAGDSSAVELIQFLVNTDGTLTAQMFVGGTEQWRVKTDSAQVSTGVWRHLALAQDATTTKPTILVDGVAVLTTNSVSVDNSSWMSNALGLDNMRIGSLNYNGAGDGFFNDGNFDEVLFINRKLSPAQVLDIYNAGTPKDESLIADGVAYFRIDGDIVPTLKDSIGSNNGVYVNCVQGDLKLDTP